MIDLLPPLNALCTKLFIQRETRITSSSRFKRYFLKDFTVRSFSVSEHVDRV